MYQDPAGELSNEDEFNYDPSTNTLAVENITGTTVTGSGVVKGSNTFGQRYATQAATNRAAADTASLTVERYFTVTAEGNGESFNIQSNTPSAGNKIVRKIWYKDEAFEATDVDTWTLLHTFAADTAYASTATKWQEYLDGQANGTPPFTLAISWEDIPAFTGLLDTYSGAAAAYSLRLLDSTYTGDAIRVRRASDNTEQDIGFDVNGDLDTSALTTFCTGTNGFIRTWYDQSGNANDATQSTTAAQPKIYDASTGLIEDGAVGFEKAAVEFNGTSNFLTTGSLQFSNGEFLAVAVASPANTNTNQAVFASDDRSPVRIHQALIFKSTGVVESISFNSSNVAVVREGPSYTASQCTIMAQVASGNFTTYHNGVAGSTTGSVTQRTNSDNQYIGALRYASSEKFMTGKIQEIVIYPTNQSANRAGIETNINDYYSIY
jgi:hypothetical protein